jgi:hypothetical protein
MVNRMTHNSNAILPITFSLSLFLCKFISNEDLANIFATHVLKVSIVWRVIFYRRKYTLFAQKMIVLENKSY